MAKIKQDFGSISGGGNGKYDTVTLSTSSFTEIELGFVPTKVFAWTALIYQTAGNWENAIYEIDVADNKAYYWIKSASKTEVNVSSFMYVSGTKLYLKQPNSDYSSTFNYVAIQE